VEGAAANDLPGAVPDKVRQERRARLMALQASISKAKLKAKVKRKIEVLVDEPGVGRSKADAPEIDGLVRFKGGKSGEFAEVLIDRADEHDLYGRMQ
jgi:ribosomal protein S12 methylthiotransferase